MDKETKDKFLRELIGASYEKVYTFIDRKQPDKDFVQDVVQETFLEAYRRVDMLMEHPNPSGWLYVTARNKVMALNRRKKDLQFFAFGEGANLENQIKEEEQYGEIELEEAIKATVGEEDYEMLCDYYVNGYNSGEIAKKYGMERGSLRMYVSRLKKKLRESL